MKKIYQLAEKIASLKAIHLFAVILILSFVSIWELYTFYPEKYYTFSAFFSTFAYSVWFLSIGTLLYQKAKKKPQKRFYFFLFSILILPVMQVGIFFSKFSLVPYYQSGEVPNVEAINTVQFFSYLYTIAFGYLHYFLTIILRQNETGETKMEWKTFGSFIFLILGVWNVTPRIRHVLFPKQPKESYQPRTQKIANIFVIIFIFGYIIASVVATWKIMQKSTNRYYQKSEIIQRSQQKLEEQQFIEKLKTLPDKEIEQAILEYAVEKIYQGTETEIQAFTKLPRGFQIVYTTRVLEDEVNNGGFNQYFYNSSGQFADKAVESYQALGLYDHAQIVREAIQVFNDESELHTVTKEKATLEAFMNSYQETKLGEVDHKFYDLPEGRITRVKYIRANYQDFITK